jgi:diguanylate cyclase (GGDEF)-like protein
VMDGSPASAHVIALEPVLLLEIADETFWRLASASHQFAINLLLLLAHRMRNNNSSLHRATVISHQLERDATVDVLTGLHNRRWWDDRFPRVVERSTRDHVSASLLVIDVDRFKSYNDNYGHVGGDLVLRIVASTLTMSVRPADIVARYGGEEFVALLPATDLNGAMTAAERLRQAVAQAAIGACEGKELPSVTISVGVASLRAHDTPSTLFQRADAALYRAKSNGRDQCAAESDT